MEIQESGVLAKIDDSLKNFYSNLLAKSEGIGNSKYNLALQLDVLSLMAAYIGVDSVPTEITTNAFKTSIYWSFTFLEANNAGRSIQEPIYDQYKSIIGEKSLHGRLNSFSRNLSGMFRLPSFMLGVAFVAKGVYDGLDALVTQTPDSLFFMRQNISLGTALLAMSSSAYVKDV